MSAGTVPVSGDIPQWKKDLIARLKHQNKKVAAIANGDDRRQYSSSSVSVQQPRPSKNRNVRNGDEPVAPSVRYESVVKRGHVNGATERPEIMVQQERNHNHEHDLVDMVTNGYRKDADSDSEDLHYGPGIVNKLKNKYLSLALREAVSRPSILQLRKATSLENLLDEDTRQTNNKHFLSKSNGNDTRRNQLNNRYRHSRGHEIKRARSVETISRTGDAPLAVDDVRANRQSLHEETLIAEETRRRPAAPAKKSPPDSADVATAFAQKLNRPKRVPPLMSEKEKPPTNVVKQAKMIFEKRPEQRTRAPPQTGDVAAKVDSFNTIIVKAKGAKKPHVKAVSKPQVGDHFFQKLITEKPPKTLDLTKAPIKLDLKELPSPIPDVSRVDKENAVLSETPDLILTASPLLPPPASPPPLHRISQEKDEEVRSASPKRPPSPAREEFFGFDQHRRSPVATPTSQELKIDVNGRPDADRASGRLLLPTKAARTSDASDVATAKKKKKSSRTAETSNTSVFNFTDRKDVPDYISNDVSRSPSRPELPRPGEGGIILIPGATILESFTDEDEEILKSLEGPPSPCDVTFINDNVLIDGKSSLSQRTTKQAKLRISFLDGPEVYEYPSETSMMTEEDPAQGLVVAQVGHTVPNLGGSSLANYTPRSTEEFHPGISRTSQPAPPATLPDAIESEDHNHQAIEESARPFSEGRNADMLF